jgi:prepilin-type N-terminal cleavage/methylation domain-containing protein
MENLGLQIPPLTGPIPAMWMILPVGIEAQLKARSTRAFTLTELLVVVAIMGILAGAAAVSLRGMRSPTISSAANEVASALKITRQMAIASGRMMYLVIPIATNALTTNLFRAYAIFEEVRPGETTSEPQANNSYYTNPITTTSSIFIAKTDWRLLPEGAVFCNLAAGSYSSSAGGDAMPPIGQLKPRVTGPGMGQSEWQYFESYTNFDVRHPRTPGTSLANLSRTPFLAFYPTGRAFYTGDSYRQGAALRITQGYTKGEEVAVTDTNLYYQVETDPNIGRVRIRTRESFAK